MSPRPSILGTPAFRQSAGINSGKEPEQKFTKNGIAYAVLSLATKTSWKHYHFLSWEVQNDNDEWESRTEWHRIIVIWNRTHFQAVFRFEGS
jgi:hypothetical protein